jgi:hypothetical protein
MPGRAEKYSILKLRNNFSIAMWLHTHYKQNVPTMPATKINHIFLPVVSAEIHTNRSEARHKRMGHKLEMLDSYLYNLPNSANKYL